MDPTPRVGDAVWSTMEKVMVAGSRLLDWLVARRQLGLEEKEYVRGCMRGRSVMKTGSGRGSEECGMVERMESRLWGFASRSDVLILASRSRVASSTACLASWSNTARLPTARRRSRPAKSWDAAIGTSTGALSSLKPDAELTVAMVVPSSP